MRRAVRLMCSGGWATVARVYVVVALSAFAAAVPAKAQTHDDIRACAAIPDDAERLACFDRTVRKLTAPKFEGRLSTTTERFHIDQPTQLRYESDGPIFVLYLKADDGSIIQNLHIGGGGQATYLIEQPGTYFLDVSGSETWRIWLEPPSTTNANQRGPSL
ncbi:hypothetical protein [Hyphomicrobium sp. D-2]|uniref:hypothetical protein n=1 Tax=Hyphomicrobium sp. D-2 TaxID=3041621 RepID=UPI0024562427|nr:hypothetical protein [Hyphomicrobium sp. D-2]MDH4981036.1 hypothetical protein [Hyphomicrobium sp. D-2]